MLKTRNFLFILFLLIAWSFPARADDKKIKVVATQTIFADLVRQVGKDRVEVKAIASPKYNVHFMQPTPSDVRAVAYADLYVNAGLDLEAWSDPLLEAAGNQKLFRGGSGNVDLSQGIEMLNLPTRISRAEGDLHIFGNPHYQMSPENARIMVKTIVDKLKTLDEQNAGEFEQNGKAFLDTLEEKIRDWKTVCSHCRGEEVLSYHADIAYFVQFLGMKSEQFLEPKPGIPPTPKHLAFLENYVTQKHIKVILLPTYYPRGEADKLANKLGIKVLTICQGVAEVPGTEDTLKFFDYNIKQISEGLR